MLAEKPVFKMYIKGDCPYCEKARDLILNDLEASLHTIDVTDEPDLRKSVIKETGQKTVPVVYLGEEFVGGCDDLINLRQSGEIELKILREEVKILRDEVTLLKGRLL